MSQIRCDCNASPEATGWGVGRYRNGVTVMPAVVTLLLNKLKGKLGK